MVPDVQLNVFSLAASKQLGAFEMGAGALAIDNHHFLPQSASFTAGVTGRARHGSSSAA